jgi:hypothetical protein
MVGGARRFHRRADLSIEELAGHMSLETTQRYMHLSASAPREAIRALESGGILETEAVAEKKPKGDA